ncbi:MAG: KTSC domain-containing protein, partial [Candidatus Lokiarchaeota archaeon]|nr:KTSC domain-containing protein [Candidatus Lokiarchaeota archaeon]
GTWYDEDNSYMIIKLLATYYHYCGFPSEIWSAFKEADSFGTYYIKYIKGHYDCRCNYVPKYKNSED